MTNQKRAKVIAVLVGFLPLPLIPLAAILGSSNSVIATAAIIYHLPAFSLIGLIQTFSHSSVLSIALLALLPLWDLCVGIFLCKCIDLFWENNPQGLQNFDWTGFWVRAVCGALLGVLIAWRLWISYGKGATVSALILTVLVLASLLGVAFGFLYRDNFWSRPL